MKDLRSKTYITTACRQIAMHLFDHVYVVERSQSLGELPRAHAHRIISQGMKALHTLERFHEEITVFFEMLTAPVPTPPRPSSSTEGARGGVVLPFARSRKKR